MRSVTSLAGVLDLGSRGVKFGGRYRRRPVNEFFVALAKRWSEAAYGRGAKIDDPTLDSRVAEEILELARVVAHTSERRFAPLATFTAGVATERLRASKGTLEAGAAAAYVREVREALEREAPPR